MYLNLPARFTLTAHNITQYVSRADRPVSDLPSGWINERVNTSDWLEPPGEFFRVSCWPEIACLLTYIEIPGLYLRTDTGDISVMDHVNAHVRLFKRIPFKSKFKTQHRIPPPSGFWLKTRRKPRWLWA